MRASQLVVYILVAGVIPVWPQEPDRLWHFGGSQGQAWPDWVELNIMADDVRVPGALQPRELRPDENLFPQLHGVVPFSFVQNPVDPFWVDGMPRLWQAYQNIFAGSALRLAQSIDGDPGTFFAWPTGAWALEQFYTVDLGEQVPLERFVVRPPRETDRFGEPWARYIPKHGQLSASRAGAQLATEGEGECCQYQPLDIILGSVKENISAPIEMRFPLQYLRFLRWKTFEDSRLIRDIHDEFCPPPKGCPWVERLVYGELEAYGRGFARESRYLTQVIDLGRPATLGRMFFGVSKWRRTGTLVEAPDAGGEIDIRVRAGADSEPRTYRTFNDQGGLEEVDQDEWQSLQARRFDYDPEFVGWQGPITEDRENWTPWSGPVTTSGTRLEMPSSQFFQLHVEFSSDRPTDMARLDSLSIEILPLLVPTLVGEVGEAGSLLTAGHALAPMGEPTDLTYAFCAKFDSAGYAGFDAVHIATPAVPGFVRLRMGSPLQVVAPDSFSTDPAGLTVYLPEPVAADQVVEIELQTSFYTLSTQLRGEVFNRAESEQRQRIEAGDATDQIRSNRLQVLAEGADLKGVIGQLELQPSAVTPNGDGINDRLEIVYSLVGVTEADVEISFFTLSGDRVHEIQLRAQGAGRHSVEWTGTDATGRRLGPGMYLCQVTAHTGRGRFARTKAIGVAY